MRDSRRGECLWQEWIGDGLEPDQPDSVIFYTEEHVDLEHEVVRRALASALQRDGVAVTLGDGYKAIERAAISESYAGTVDGSLELHVCDETGETSYGDMVDDLLCVTLVEVPVAT